MTTNSTFEINTYKEKEVFFSIHNLYTSEKRNIERLIYDTEEDKYGYVNGIMEVLPLSIPITENENEIEDLNDLITMITSPQGEVVIVNEKINLICLTNIDVSRVEAIYLEKNMYKMKVFFKAKKEKQPSTNGDRRFNTDRSTES